MSNKEYPVSGNGWVIDTLFEGCAWLVDCFQVCIQWLVDSWNLAKEKNAQNER